MSPVDSSRSVAGSRAEGSDQSDLAEPGARAQAAPEVEPVRDPAPSANPPPSTSDDAIRTAAKVAIDAGEMDRARALLDLLDAKPRTSPVLTLAARRPQR